MDKQSSTGDSRVDSVTGSIIKMKDIIPVGMYRLSIPNTQTNVVNRVFYRGTYEVPHLSI